MTVVKEIGINIEALERVNLGRYSFFGLIFSSERSATTIGKFDCFLEKVILQSEDWKVYNPIPREGERDLDEVFQLEGGQEFMSPNKAQGLTYLSTGPGIELVGFYKFNLIVVDRNLEYTPLDFDHKFVEMILEGVLFREEASMGYVSLADDSYYVKMWEAHRRGKPAGHPDLQLTDLLERLTIDDLPGYLLHTYDRRDERTAFKRLLTDQLGSFEKAYGLRKSVMVNFVITNLNNLHSNSEFSIITNIQTLTDSKDNFIFTSCHLKIKRAGPNLFVFELNLLSDNTINRLSPPPQSIEYRNPILGDKFVSYGLIISQSFLGYEPGSEENVQIKLTVSHYLHHHSRFLFEDKIELEGSVHLKQLYSVKSKTGDQMVRVVLDQINDPNNSKKENIYGVRLLEINMMNGAYSPYD